MALTDDEKKAIVQDVVAEIKNNSSNKVQSSSEENDVAKIKSILALSASDENPMRQIPIERIATKQNIVWSGSSNINTYTTAGIYEIKGERTSTNDNLPFTNTGGGHTIHARLVVLDSSIPSEINSDDKCVTQILSLSNRVGGDGNIYIRTGQGYFKNGITWEKWATMQTNTNVGQVGSLDTLIDNGIYSGVWTYGSYGSYPLTFVCVVINDYFVGVSPRRISQFLYGLSKFDGSVLFQTRVGVGDTTIEWGQWKDINEDNIDKRIAEKIDDLKVVDLGYNNDGKFLDSLTESGLYRGGYYDKGVYKQFDLTVINNPYQDTANVSQFMKYNTPNGESSFIVRFKSYRGSWTEWQIVNKDEIATLISNETSKLLNGTDPDKIDSLKDLIAWVEEHGTEAATMASAIETNATNISSEVTRAKAEEAELLKRLQGTSANSNPKTDPFKYIHLGQTDDNMATLKNKIDDLANKESVGFYRIVANNQSIVELHVIQMTSTLRGVMQVLKGPLTIYESGNFAIATNEYTIAHRYCLPNSISAWSISNKKNIVEYVSGRKDIEPKEYPFKYLGTFDTLDSLIAKLDTLAIITTDSPNTKLVGSFRAIRDQKIYTIYNDCASWNGVFIQTIMGCLTIGNDGKLVSSDSAWGIYRRTSSKNGNQIKWGNWTPVADGQGSDQYLGSFSSYEELIDRLDSLWYNQDDVKSDGKGNCTGWFKAKVSGHPIDIRSQYTWINGGHWQQIISGFFALQSDNSITLTSDDYQTLFRNHTGNGETGKWSNWKKISAVQ